MINPLKELLLLSGAVLFLLGLLTGVAIPAFTNPRLGLSAHLAGIQNALVLFAVGAVWSYVRLSTRQLAVTAWSLITSLYGFWVALTLAAAWGTSRATPIAGAGHAGSVGQESIVTWLLHGSSVISIAGAGLLVVGFWRAWQQQPAQPVA